MGFLDSSSSIVTAILTRKGRELLANNDGSFKITKFAFGDDEINYQMYNAATDDDTDILNLPVLEPSSNELTALRYRLVTAPQGAIQVAYLVVSPSQLVLQSGRVLNLRVPRTGTLSISTIAGFDSQYIIRSRSSAVATVSTGIASLDNHSNVEGGFALVNVYAGNQDGTTFIDITGRDTGAIISIPVTVTSNVATEA
jgi:hypothetical protein